MGNSLKTIVNGHGQIISNRSNNFQKQWKLVARNKWLFLLTVILSLGIVFLINRYTKPVYIVSSKVSVSEKNNNEKLMSQTSGQNSSNEFAPVDKTEEVAVLTSLPFVQKTVDALDWKVSYFRQDKIGKTELYKKSPFNITFPEPSLLSNIQGKEFKIEFKSEKDFTITEVKEGEPDKKSFSFGTEKTININGCPIVVSINSFDSKRDIGRNYFFTINYNVVLAFAFRDNLEVSSGDDESGIIQINLKTSTPEKGVDFINKLTEQYIKDKYEEKSRSATQSLAFINDQLNTVKVALSGSESNLASFKAANTFSDPSAMTNRNLDALAEIQNETFNLRQQENYYSSLLNDLNANSSVDQLISPSSVGIQDGATSILIKELSDLQTLKNSYAASGDSKNPYLQDIDIKIAEGKKALRQTVSKLQNTSRLRMSQLNARAGQFQSNVYKIPLAERQFTDINRSRDFNENLYLFLMQKRVEAGIMKASAIVEDRIIEPALFSTVPLEPKPTRNYIFGIILALVVPFGYLKLKETLNKKVGGKDEIQDSTTIPIIGSIYHNLETSALVIKKESRSAISESFRILRYNLTQFLKNSNKKVILFTSTKSGEGKSFSSINFALSLAIAKKKTVLINLDLRLPSKAYEEIAAGNDVGISTYLSEAASIKDIIQKTDNQYLDYIHTGELPQNPAELLMEGNNLDSLIKYLRTIYDYIIIDTPPLGVVADPLIISSYSDVNVLVVREKYTLKENLFELEDMFNEGKLKDVVMIINDVRLEKQGYKNAYYYKKPR